MRTLTLQLSESVLWSRDYPSAMAAPRPPSLKEIEEDLAAAPHTDPAFSFPTNTEDKPANEAEDEVTAVAKQAVQFVQSYHQLKKNYAHSLPHTLSTVEQHIAELRTAIGGSSQTAK